MTGWIAIFLDRFLYASVQGGIALLVAFAIDRLTTLHPKLKLWLWRLAFLKLFISLVCSSAVDIPVLAPTIASNKPNLSLPQALPAWVLGLIGCAWIFGAAVRFIQISASRLSSRRLVADADNVADGKAIRALSDMCFEVGLSRSPFIKESPWALQPMLIGGETPTIVLPYGASAKIEQNKLRAVVAHELAHLVHRDLQWGWLLSAVQTVFWFHPIVWLASRHVSLLQEVSADKVAMWSTGSSPSEYADILLSFAAAPRTSILHFALSGHASALQERVRMLYSRPSAMRPSIVGSALVATCMAMVPIRLTEIVPSVEVPMEIPNTVMVKRTDSELPIRSVGIQTPIKAAPSNPLPQTSASRMPTPTTAPGVRPRIVQTKSTVWIDGIAAYMPPAPKSDQTVPEKTSADSSGTSTD